MMSKLVLPLCLVLLFPNLQAQKNDSAGILLKKILSRYEKVKGPGCSCAIRERGRTVASYSFGWADIEKRIPFETKTIVSIASLSKHFTAYGLLLLQKEGKLKLDDPVTKYFPIPALEDTIKLYHLLTHTAGFHESNDIFDILYLDPEHFRSMKKISDFASGHQELEFRPGTRYSYNNTGYSVAAFIIEKVSGMAFDEFMAKEIFRPLGMDFTSVRTKNNLPLPGLAAPYKMDLSGGFSIDSLHHNFYGFTGVFTNIHDLEIWDRFIDSLEKKHDPVYAALTEPRFLMNGKSLDYGYGLEIGHYHGWQTISHSGRDNGYTSYYLRFPEKDFSVLAVCNNRQGVPWDICYSVSDHFFPAQKHVPVTYSNSKIEVFPIQTGNPEKFKGFFWSPQGKFNGDAVVKIDYRDSALWLVRTGKHLLMTPNSGVGFSVQNTNEKWGYTFDIPEMRPGIVVVENGDTTRNYFPVNEYRDELQSMSIQGEYFSSEIGLSVKIQKRNGKWFLDHESAGEMFLVPLFQNGFSCRMGLLTWENDRNDRFRLQYDKISHLYFYRKNTSFRKDSNTDTK